MNNQKNNNANKKNNRRGGIWIWLILIIIIIIAIIVASIFLKSSPDALSVNEVQSYLNSGKINSVTIQRSASLLILRGTYLDENNNLHAFVVNNIPIEALDAVYGIGSANSADVLLLEQIIYNSGNTFQGITNIPVDQTGQIVGTIVPLVVMILIYVFLFWFLFRSMGAAGAGGAGNLFGMGKSKAKLSKSTVKFSDVAGINEEKNEIVELVDYMKNPQKYQEAGARIPKGVLLEGPPGTGKTLLAKAVAGEANVNFYATSGSEFDEMFVGLGASRIREMFQDAKNNAPCVIFIDEIDALARKRTANVAGSNDQTLNQLLVEMDGFDTNSGVIIMAATNRSDVLDPAILRPGRFDRTIQVSLPDIKEREAILKLHARNKKISPTIDWYRISQRTPGFSGAQLENVLNEAAILTVRENTPEITITQIDEAIDRVVGGPAKKSRVMTPKDKDIVSYHESGHALVGLKLESASKVQKVTIIPRGNAGGYTITTPNDESMFQTKQDLFATIAGYMGGRAAEAIIFGDDNVTTGADDDLEKATNIARQMVVRFGMSEALGMAKLVTQEDLSYGRTSGSYSDQTAAAIDEEVTKILTTAYNQANKIIRDNREELELLAESLRVMETITAEQIEFIDQNLALPDDVKAEKVKYDEELKRIKDGDIIDIDLADVEPKPKKEAKKPTTTKKKPKKKPEDETDDQKDDSSSKGKK
ncbi:ATP-dependent zinc metalloprotease FtsH [Mesoplasma sp. JKS002658]|uniref:ATP-dependent zinc metalloprotease FtsH n=1 Tax=Mesoplasma whartonense TaxID=2878854 RepID=UPI002022AE4F|nr:MULTISPECIES: ATP-dependent zinc metalloprotease FtsH [unclassified Mesoplasma]MCL8211651.1 ATP-dependent zinc metalloprotease FtsH [Mesoplasma sp. JKS002664]MCL8212390.1 ATP-dependent zinc metalloprotease FtsH [Mesoplasma sp. JKS002662]MCL8212770.1 ATP-dependent zinc metalloprotease FtsH [Mesoplasma sp. JKS002661]MCL8213537.1 ATP-dependent zinc metalloprotease FtsH [Mesoplasma sp. JKS002660]MCL8214365.1 ATP-dependent zinc metalloprotease FtsH [Mesoplasma sp. JKS002658]